MKVKRLIAIMTLAAFVMGAAAGCGSNETSGGTTSGTDNANSSENKEQQDSGKTSGGGGSLKIGLTMSNRDQWLSTMEQAALKEAEKEGVELKTFDSNVDVVTQLSHVTTCANDGYDAMIINLVNTDNAQEMIDAAGGMPIVFVNRTPGNADDLLEADKIVYVGSSEEEAGDLQGKYIAKLLQDANKEDANIVILTGTLGMQATTLRTEAAKKALEESGLKVNYAFEDTADWDRAKAMEKFVQFMGTGKPYDAVICNNDEMALGVVEAMMTNGEGKVTVPVAGVDATDSALQSIKEGNLTFSAFQNAAGQGQGAVRAAIKLASGEACEMYNWIPFEPVEQSNVDNYMK